MLLRCFGVLARGFSQGIQALGVLDPRSLALFRILLGSLLILDAGLRLIDLRAFYTDFGVLPRTVVIEHHSPAAHFSLMMGSGSAWFQALGLVAMAAAGACLALGVRTRIAAIASWLLLVSVQRRNPLILQGGDVLFRIMLLFAAFLPLNRAWSVDMRSTKPKPLRPSLLYFAYVVQIAFVYIVTGIAKYKQAAWRDGRGVGYALWLQQFTTWFGDLVGSLPMPMLTGINTGVLAVEIVLPLFLFLPWRVTELRNICIVTMVSFHLFVLVTLKVGLFSIISIVAWLPLLPASFWDWIGSRLQGGLRDSFLMEGQAASSCAKWSYRSAGSQAVGALMIAFLLVWNSANVFSAWRSALISPQLRQVALFFGLDQTWEMFSRPITADGWILVPALRADGTKIDLFSGEEFTGPQRPASVSASFPGDRWRKYWRNLLGDSNDHQRLRLGLGKYLCRRGGEEQDPARRIEALQMIFVREAIKPDGTHAAPEKVLLWSHECRTGLLKKWEKELPFALLPFPKGR